jgi:hypothetical protein
VLIVKLIIHFLALAQHFLDGVFVDFVSDGAISQVTFSFGSFFRKNVAMISVMSSYFTGTRQSESFLGSRFGFNFWHFSDF